MTAESIIGRTDSLMPNQYTEEQKLEWLSELDGQVFETIIKTHEDAPVTEFHGHSGISDELLIPYPYGGEIYQNYLFAKICEANAELGKYNQFAESFDAAMSGYSDWYNRNHGTRQSRFRF